MPLDPAQVKWDSPSIDHTKVVWDDDHQNPTAVDKIIASVPARVAAGAADPVLGINALYDKLAGNTGQFITSAGGYLPNTISDWFGQAANSGQVLANKETKTINDARDKMGATPRAIDWARVAGNVLSPVNAALAPGAGAGIGAKIASGAAMGASQPVDTNNNPVDPTGWGYTGKVLANTGIGGAVSGVLGSLGSKAKSPEELRRAAQVKILQDYGVQPSIGQQIGGNVGQVEEQIGSIPVVGNIVKNAQITRPVTELNRGVYADVLSSIGDKVPDDLALGRPSVDYVQKAVENAYDDVLPKMSLPLAAAKDGIDEVVSDAATLPDAQKGQLGSWVKKITDAASDGSIPGPELKSITSDLRKKAFSLASDQSSDARDLGQSLSDLHNAIMEATRAANPDTAPALDAADAAYTKLVRLNRAAASIGASDGVFTPAQLSAAVLGSASRRSSGRAAGTLPMQDISDAAQAILTAKTRNSGTPERTLLAAALAATLANPHGAVAALPYAVGGGGALMGAYSRPGQELLGKLLSSPSLADALRKAAPGMSPYINKAADAAGPYAARGATAIFGQ